MTTPATAPGQHLMLDWLRLMTQFTPYMSGVGKEAWDAWHSQLKQQTQQFLSVERETADSFIKQVQSLQVLVDKWIGE